MTLRGRKHACPYAVEQRGPNFRVGQHGRTDGMPVRQLAIKLALLIAHEELHENRGVEIHGSRCVGRGVGLMRCHQHTARMDALMGAHHDPRARIPRSKDPRRARAALSEGVPNPRGTDAFAPALARAWPSVARRFLTLSGIPRRRSKRGRLPETGDRRKQVWRAAGMLAPLGGVPFTRIRRDD